jgi:hypothetical protein
MPDGEELNESLVCPQCGATVEPPSTLEKAVEDVKDTISKLAGGDDRSPRK